MIKGVDHPLHYWQDDVFTVFICFLSFAVVVVVVVMVEFADMYAVMSTVE